MKNIFAILFCLAIFCPAPSLAGDGRYCSATGAAAVSVSCRAYDNALIERVGIKLSAAATTSENVVVTLDSGLGAAYDTVLLTFDPSTLGGTSFVWVPDYPLSIGPSDAIVVTYTNTDARTYGVTVRYSL
jgi:hypothetical protein